MKRVANLYRVSTKKQVDLVKDDIPMQRIACHEFAERQGWVIVMEKEEKGVSGFKVSASKRDAIQELKEAAVRGEFDVLLVFMFDRLGRIENETPFILEWFTEHGIEVWSVNEGQQKMESHSDKLMNYIRFWQASGESEKTSIRVRTRHQQMVAEGIYTGGPIPFGYRLVDKGRKNKRGKPALDLEIDPELEPVVKGLFSRVINEGYGSHQLAVWLNELGCKSTQNCDMHSSNVLRILRNEVYRGYFVRGEARSERIEELQIISDQDFFRVQEILEQRTGKIEEKRTVSMNNKSRSLISGNLFCAHCGCRMIGSRRVEKNHRKDGSETRREYGIYVCYHSSRKLNDCDGPTTYLADKVNRCIVETVHEIFDNIAGCPEEEKIQLAYRNSLAASRAEQQKISTQLDKDTKQLNMLRSEIANALSGDSIYSSEDLTIAIQAVKSRIKENEEKLRVLSEEEEEKKKLSESIIPAYKRFRTWALEFDEAPLESKRMIISELFSRIELGRNYKVHCEVNFTYKQFCTEWATLEKKLNATA